MDRAAYACCVSDSNMLCASIDLLIKRGDVVKSTEENRSNRSLAN